MIHYFINSDPIPFFHSLMNKNVVPSSGRKPNNCTSKLTFFFFKGFGYLLPLI